MTAFNAHLITALTTFKLGATKRNFIMFNYFQIVKFTSKFRLRITYQKILMAFNFGVTIYIVCKLLSR